MAYCGFAIRMAMKTGLRKKIAQIIRELVTEVVLPEVGKIDKLLSSSIGVLY